MMSLKQIAESSAALGNQLKANIPVMEATEILSTLQPELATFWLDATRSIGAGNPLSHSLKAVWTDSLVSAVIAGEEAGKSQETFKRIEATIKIQLELRKTLMKLAYPFGIGIVGIVLFVLMMVFVVPMTTGAFAGVVAGEVNVFTSMSIWMGKAVKDYWMYELAAIVTGVVVFSKWIQSTEGKESTLSFFLDFPIVGIALRDLYFGLWAEYMALMCTAGIPTIQALILTIKVLPEKLQAGVRLFERDLAINSLSMSKAANPQMQSEEDPRRAWPIYICRAFIVGERTGDIDVEMLHAAPLLTESGLLRINRAIFFGSIASTAFAGILIAMSFLALYLPMFTAIRNAR